MSGFSQSQIDAFMTLFGATFSTIETPEPPPAPDTSDQQQQAVTVSQPIQPAKEEQEHKPLQQVIAEKHTEKASSSKTTTANTVLRQATKQICRDVTIRLSNTPRLTSLLAILPTTFASLLPSLPGYIHQAEDMEATGQG